MPQIPRPGVSIHKKSKTFKGFTLFAPIRGNRAYLIDMKGEVVHKWKLDKKSEGGAINHAMLLPGGHLFIDQEAPGKPPVAAGHGGRLREYDWDGKIVWDHIDRHQHHDARKLPNGNAIYLAWEIVPKKIHKRIKGGLPGTEGHGGHIYGDVVREVNRAGETVWEWRCWEHMTPENHPIMGLYSREEFAHANTLCPLPNGDLLIGFRIINTIVIVDKKTKKVKWSHRDDLWGGQHDPQLLDNGNILLFANGNFIPEPQQSWPFSRVIELNPKTKKTVWSWQAPSPLEFNSPHISGVQRLPNGNTLVCEGGYGRLFEVTQKGEMVWEYASPFYLAHPKLGQTNWIFRCKRYAADAPELAGRLK